MGCWEQGVCYYNTFFKEAPPPFPSVCISTSLYIVHTLNPSVLTSWKWEQCPSLTLPVTVCLLFCLHVQYVCSGCAYAAGSKSPRPSFGPRRRYVCTSQGHAGHTGHKATQQHAVIYVCFWCHSCFSYFPSLFFSVPLPYLHPFNKISVFISFIFLSALLLLFFYRCLYLCTSLLL